MSLNKQLAIFSADAARPSPYDLSGLLLGPGQMVRMGGTARISVVVDAAWRVHVLAAEFAARGLETSWEPAAVEGHYGVRTAYTGVLAPLGAAWLRGAVKQPPTDFALDGARLRMWYAAAGTRDDDTLTLRVGTSDEACHPVALRLLAVLGVSGELVRGPAVKINGRRRLARFAELVGDRPAAAPDTW